ncbi:MAG: transcriptional repressor [Hyphomicrobiaceae bacterium]|nr:transcriptional repressor [Hyphomicrobiaceae bacterium]
MRRPIPKRRPAAEQDAMIAGALQAAGGPVSAYELIEILRPKATLAPQSVYRALERLIGDGHAHRLESLNAFVACSRSCHKGVAVFAICEGCGKVSEFEEATAVASLQNWAKAHEFALSAMTLELRGRCEKCSPGP